MPREHPQGVPGSPCPQLRSVTVRLLLSSSSSSVAVADADHRVAAFRATLDTPLRHSYEAEVYALALGCRLLEQAALPPSVPLWLDAQAVVSRVLALRAAEAPSYDRLLALRCASAPLK